MKYAFMSFSCPELNLEDMLALAVQYGYDGLEPRIGSKHGHGLELDTSPADRARFKEISLESGIALACLATSCAYADPARHDESVADTHRAIDLAADVGAPSIRVFGGQFPETLSREEASANLVKGLNETADHAAEREVAICLETHDAWCDPAHIVQVMRAVDKPSVAVNWDIMHPVLRPGISVESSFETLLPWIKHIHFHDGILDDKDSVGFAAMGEGDVNHKIAVELLSAGGYTGYLSGEWINWESYDLHLPREIARIKAYEPDNA